ncbi:MAG: hypothetical protein M0P57_03420 [Syntrophales bacterium]|jgi:hypothetical protein|nr:hypothetical protein [Syntrophales bacterium]MDY0044249.1 hypothetical protein [Syntrophales bacterium]
MEFMVLSAIFGVHTLVIIIIGILTASVAVKGRKTVEKTLSSIENNYQTAMELMDRADELIEKMNLVGDKAETISRASEASLKELSEKLPDQLDQDLYRIRAPLGHSIVKTDSWINDKLTIAEKGNRKMFSHIFLKLSEMAAAAKGIETGLHYFFTKSHFGVHAGLGKKISSSEIL